MGVPTNAVGIYGKSTIFSASSNCLLPSVVSYFVTKYELILMFIATTQIVEESLVFMRHVWVGMISISITWVVIKRRWVFWNTKTCSKDSSQAHTFEFSKVVG